MTPAGAVVEAAHVLVALGLVDAFGHVSARDGDVLTTGREPGIAVARMHVLATACRVHAAAHEPVPLDDDDLVSGTLSGQGTGGRPAPTG